MITRCTESAEIITHLIVNAPTKAPEARRQLAERAEVPRETVLEFVKLSDLSRLEGVKGVRARLYFDAGLETPEAFTLWEPEPLRKMLVEYVARTGFDGIAPLPQEIRSTIAAARQLPKLVQY